VVTVTGLSSFGDVAFVQTLDQGGRVEVRRQRDCPEQADIERVWVGLPAELRLAWFVGKRRWTAMIDVLKIFAALAAGYLLGSLNTAVIVGKIYGKDISKHGSKSAGLTNTLRVLGKPAAALVLVGDILKGVIACLIGLHLGVYVYSGAAKDCMSLLAAGAGAVVGHNWPIYFGFKGGKGVLTAVTVMFMTNWVMALMSLGVFVIIVAVTRYVSLGTICATIFFVAISFIPAFRNTFYFQIFTGLMALVLIFKHKENIQRLLSGAENKLTF
jgi:glycerol-3-phosphate acyltransferase PlsY